MRAFFYDIANVPFARCRAGTRQELETLGGPNSSAAALEDKNRVDGAADSAAGTTHAALYTAGGLHDLGMLGGPHSTAAAINAMSQVAGRKERTMGALQPMHLALIAVAVLLVFGPRKLPELARGVGEAIKELKQTLHAGAEAERGGAEATAAPLAERNPTRAGPATD